MTLPAVLLEAEPQMQALFSLRVYGCPTFWLAQAALSEENYRSTEWFALEETSKGHLAPLVAMNRDTHSSASAQSPPAGP